MVGLGHVEVNEDITEEYVQESLRATAGQAPEQILEALHGIYDLRRQEGLTRRLALVATLDQLLAVLAKG